MKVIFLLFKLWRQKPMWEESLLTNGEEEENWTKVVKHLMELRSKILKIIVFFLSL